jgi:hypothetical protein
MFLLVLERAVVTALRFLGAGGVSDSSSERIVGRLCFGLAAARLRFGLRGGLGMSRWIQRRSADNNKGLIKKETQPHAKRNIRPMSQYALALES